MAIPFISAFIVIGLLVFLGVVAVIGVTNAKTKQAVLCKQPHEQGLDSEE